MNRSTAAQVGFRTMRIEDVEAGLRLCRASGWNQTRRDWEMFLRLSPDGCRVAVKNGEVIGTVTTVRYEDRFAWIGMVLVEPAERGQGIGAGLMAEALALTESLPSIRLDATPAGHKVYRKLGFVDEYSLSRMEAVISPARLMRSDSPARPMTTDDLAAVAAFDRTVFGADRHSILEWMLDGAPEYAWIIAQQGKVLGYTFGRHGMNFEHLGPVIATDQQTARQLASACLAQQAGKRFVIDAPHQDPDWRSWLESTGFCEQRQLTRMFSRDNPFPGLPQHQFGILGPEFG